MDRRGMFRILAGGAAMALAGCAPVYYGPEPRPDWRYDYYYYPHVDVYFHVYSGYYFYRDRDAWRRTRVLPSVYVLDPRYRVNLRIRDDRPYVRHPQHRQAYPPPPQFRPDRNRDRQERQYHTRQHEEYRKRRGP